MDVLERSDIIGEIARRKTGAPLGKTAMMKLLHLLQDGLNLPLGYRFTLYNYGPYDTQVMSDIDFAESLGRMTVKYEGSDQGYRIEPAGTHGTLSSAAKNKIAVLMAKFGAMTARDLELRSTLLFLSHGYSGDSLVAQLHDLKPKYLELETRRALEELRRRTLSSPPKAE